MDIMFYIRLLFHLNVNVMITEKVQFDRNRHGGLYDRGSADSYYRRPRDPHWYPNGTYNGQRVEDLTIEEMEEYNKGYDENNDFKDWG